MTSPSSQPPRCSERTGEPVPFLSGYRPELRRTVHDGKELWLVLCKFSTLRIALGVRVIEMFCHGDSDHSG
jgi:hypothetical protein